MYSFIYIIALLHIYIVLQTHFTKKLFGNLISSIDKE